MVMLTENALMEQDVKPFQGWLSICYNLPMLKQIKKVSEYELPIKIEVQKSGGLVVTCPIWSDCFAEGDTVDEAVLEITAVAQSLIELYKEEGLKIPLKYQKTVANEFTVPVIVTA